VPLPLRVRPAAALTALGALACLWLTGWFGLNKRDPITFYGDHMLWLGYARSFVEGYGFRWSESLGFPGVRDHMYNPTFYLSQKVIMWLSARVFDNPAAVVSTFYGVGILLTYGTSCWVLRQLSIARPLAVLGSVAFVVTPYFAFRAGNHDPFAVFYSVPPGALLALRVGVPTVDADSLRQRLRDPLAWLLVLLVAASGIYFAFFTLVFVGFAGAVAAISRRNITPVLQSAAIAVGIGIGLVVTGPGLGIIDVLNGTVQTPTRQALEQSFYGLSMGDAVKSLANLPFTPEWWANGVTGMDFEGTYGEWPGVLPTIVILASAVIALGMAMAGWRDLNRQQQLVALCAGLTAFGVMFATRSGLGLLFNQVVMTSFRAQSRIMPFLTFFAIAIVLLWVEQARRSRGVSRIVVPVLLIVGLVSSVVESSPAFPLTAKQRQWQESAGTVANRDSIVEMLARLRESGARTVLQLPIVSWPEVAPIRGFTPYHFELPHVLDKKGSGVRWSYGMAARQAMFTRLSAAIDAHHDNRVVGAAAALGFDAISIEKGALAPGAVAAWISAIESELDAACRVFDDARRLLYVFSSSPADPRCTPPATPVNLNAMRYFTSEGRFGRTLLVGGGWSAPERDYTWTHGERAVVNVPAPSPDTDVTVTFDFGVFRHDAQKPKRIVFQVDDQDVYRIHIAPGEAPPQSATFSIPARHIRRDGSIEVIILTPDTESPADYGAPDPRRLGIALSEFRVQPADAGFR
jgi:hypothetical protein